MGKPGTPEDGRRNNGHWVKAGAGRPQKKPEHKCQRKTRQIRAYDREYEVIKRFVALVRKDCAKCEKAVALLELKDGGSKDE